MKKILFLYEMEMPTVGIARNYWIHLSREYNIVSRFVRLIDVKRVDLNWCDILILIRPNNALAWRIAHNVKESGRFVITMCDDDLLHLPKSHPDLPWQRNGLIRALSNSSVVLSSSRYLINEMIEYTADKRGVYMDTVVKPEELVQRNYETEDKHVKIVYAAGGGQHEDLFEKYVLPALKHVAAHNPNAFSLTFISVHPNCFGLEKVIPMRYVKEMSLLEYRKFMAESKFDIGLAPLDDSSFARCKYFNKYLEYTFSGIVGIYSNVQPYTYVVKERYNGLLADNNIKSWQDHLEDAITNFPLRITCARNAQEHVRTVFNEQSIMSKLFEDIPELSSAAGKYCVCRRNVFWFVQYKLLRCIEYLYKAGFYMKKEGIGSVLHKIISRLKQLAR